MAISPTDARKSMIFTVFKMFTLTRQELSSTRTTLLKSKLAAVELSSDIYVLSLFDDFDLTTKWSLAKEVYICLHHQELQSRLASLSAGSRI